MKAGDRVAAFAAWVDSPRVNASKRDDTADPAGHGFRRGRVVYSGLRHVLTRSA